MQGLFAVARIGTQNITPDFSPVQQTPQVGATTFAEELQARLATTAANLGTAETMAIGAIRGEVDRREVVDAVMSAEQSLQAAIAIRDKIVQAYLEVSRMQI